MFLKPTLITLMLLAGPITGLATEPPPFEALRVAHAGGALGEVTYTNSYEALNANYAKGFRYFEIDFVFTSDEKIVCLHDWKSNFRKSFGYKTDTPLTYAEFVALADKNPRFRNCTLEGLGAWLEAHPDAAIITDIKDRALPLLRQVRKAIPDAGSRVIAQIYKPREFAVARKMGYQRIIWTVYLYSGSNRDIIEAANAFSQPFAITMPKERALSPLPAALASRGIATYVHTINSEEDWLSLKTDHGVAEIYTDFLVP